MQKNPSLPTAVLRINGDGSTSRDFCYITNVVQANILAATSKKVEGQSQVYNIALNSKTSLNELFELIRQALIPQYPHLANYRPTYQAFREGDISHSQAEISRAKLELGFNPQMFVSEGLKLMMER